MFELKEQPRVGASSDEETCCRSEIIVAYLDGELDSAASIEFEQHAAACATCAPLLREHQQLLQLLELVADASFEMPLPKNFAQVVTAYAQSDMKGARAHSLALWLCVPLAALCVALLGVAGVERVMSLIGTLIKHAASVADMFGRGFYAIGIGFSVLLRAVGRSLVFSAPPLSFLAILLLAASLCLLSRLIVNYHHRPQVTE